jgi:hypothetical protein
MGALVQEVQDIAVDPSLNGFPFPMPSSSTMTAQEMKDFVVAWLRADPSRRAEAMTMATEIAQELYP